MINNREFLDFVYIGAPRSGSTWLAAVLNEHPEVWIPHNKELHFFNDRSISTFEYKYPQGIDFYKNYFKDAPKNVKLGELSPFYYFDPNSAYRIYNHFKNVQIIAMLRNPVDVIYSLYLWLREYEYRETSFEKEIEKKPQLIDIGFYHRLLTPFFDWFPKENIFVCIYEEFFEDEDRGCKELFRFLNINQDFKPRVVGQRINASKGKRPMFKTHIRGSLIRILNTKTFIPIKELLHKFKINKRNYIGTEKSKKGKPNKPTLEVKTRKILIEQFEPDICRLEKLLGIRLDIWKK